MCVWSKYLHRVVAMVAVTVAANSARANITSGSWIMDQSNKFADGVAYGQVDIEANDVAGTVEFTVDAFDVQPTYGTLSNFGLQAFGFNFDNLTSTPSGWTIALPTGWSQDNNGGNMIGFGSFEVKEVGTGSTRQDPLVFTITLPTAGEAIASNFAVNGAGGVQGTFFFAAHVAGFGNKPGSHYIGGSSESDTNHTPVPGAAVLAAIGLGIAGFINRRRS